MNLIFALDNGSISRGRRPAYFAHLSWWGLGCCLLLLLTSCNSKKYLSEDQSFLADNKIKIKSKDKIDDPAELKEKLVTLYRQDKTKLVLPFLPRHVIYYQYQKSLEKRPTRKKWSEERLIKNKPVIYDSTKSELTTEDFEKYLGLRGYRTANATFKAKTDDKQTIVYYKVDPGPRTYIDSMIFATNDTSLQDIINDNIKETFLHEDSPLDIELYNQEKSRLINIFQNEGYALIDETFIPPLEVDTMNSKVKVIMRVLNVNDSTLHKKYYVGDITIYPDYRLIDTNLLYDTTIRNVTYIKPQPEFTLKPEAIERNLFLHEGELTRLNNLNQTMRNLGRMELIKFVGRNASVDTIEIDTPRIDYTFFLTRNKKIIFGGNLELTYANIAQVNRNLIGTSISGNYRDLNLFRGAEILGINFESGVEFNYLTNSGGNNFINTLNLGTGINLSFPRFMDPFRLYHMIGHKRSEDQPALIGNQLRKRLLYDATSRINLDYNLVQIRQLYNYYSVTAGLSYLITPNKYSSTTINRIGFDLFVPSPKEAFVRDVLSKSKFLQESFGKYLFTGLIFRGYLKAVNTPAKRKGGVVRVDHSFELSGLEAWALNELISKDHEFVFGKEDLSTEGSELIKFSHFAKGELNLRYLYNLNSSIQVAFKFNPGLAMPFGRFSNQVPYLKQFFVGGPLSNRAWQIRQLGPGTYHDLNADTTPFGYYQTGDIKLDMSTEVRFPLFSYLKGAVFLDAANVWTLQKDTSREEKTDFEFKKFLKELGVGYGIGLRLDLDFFIIRVDLGYKLHSPYRLPNGTHWYNQRFPFGYTDGENKYGPEFQIGVGLPF